VYVCVCFLFFCYVLCLFAFTGLDSAFKGANVLLCDVCMCDVCMCVMCVCEMCVCVMCDVCMCVCV